MGVVLALLCAFVIRLAFRAQIARVDTGKEGLSGLKHLRPKSGPDSVPMPLSGDPDRTALTTAECPCTKTASQTWRHSPGSGKCLVAGRGGRE